MEADFAELNSFIVILQQSAERLQGELHQSQARVGALEAENDELTQRTRRMLDESEERSRRLEEQLAQYEVGAELRRETSKAGEENNAMRERVENLVKRTNQLSLDLDSSTNRVDKLSEGVSAAVSADHQKSLTSDEKEEVRKLLDDVVDTTRKPKGRK